MISSPPESLEAVKQEFEEHFRLENVEHSFLFDSDPSTDGYCYLIHTEFGSGVFSDSNTNKELKMFIIKNSAVSYASAEGLTDQQFANMKSCVEIPTKQDFLFILSNPLQPEIQ